MLVETMEAMKLPLNEQEGFSVMVEPAPKRQAKYTFYKHKTEIKK